jgi:hypothetical protein
MGSIVHTYRSNGPTPLFRHYIPKKWRPLPRFQTHRHTDTHTKHARTLTNTTQPHTRTMHERLLWTGTGGPLRRTRIKLYTRPKKEAFDLKHRLPFAPSSLSYGPHQHPCPPSAPLFIPLSPYFPPRNFCSPPPTHIHLPLAPPLSPASQSAAPHPFLFLRPARALSSLVAPPPTHTRSILFRPPRAPAIVVARGIGAGVPRTLCECGLW